MFHYKRKMSRLLLGAIPLIRLRTTENNLFQIAPQFHRTIRLASSTPHINVEKIGDDIRLHTLASDKSSRVTHDRSKKPLLLLFEFIQAKPQYVEKYASLYLGQGLDVITVRNTVYTMVTPRKARSIVDQVLHVMSNDPRLNQRSVVLKAMSGGSFLYGQMLIKLDTEPERWRSIRENCICQISDSIVGPKDFHNGLSRTLTNINVVQHVLEKVLALSAKMLHEYLIMHYIQSGMAIYNNSLKLPGLIFYSKNDLIALPIFSEEMMYEWQKKGIPVMRQCWDKSEHVGHMKLHQTEYVAAVKRFLNTMFPVRSERCRQ